MILIVTSKDDFTADHVIIEFKKRKISFFRLNTETFPFESYLSWSLNNKKEKVTYWNKTKKLNFKDVKSVWYRRPKPPEIKTRISKFVRDFIQDEVKNTFSGIWRSLECFWVSKPDNIYKSSSKIDQMYFASKYGFNVPGTLITNKPEEAKKFIADNHNEIIFKPIYKSHISTNKGEKILFANKYSKNDDLIFENIKYSPIMIQQYIPKMYDIRVNIFGKKLFATEIHSQNIAFDKVNEDWRRGILLDIPHKIHKLPIEIEEKCFKIINHYDLQFSAFDLIFTPSKEYFFLEMNPNGQWAWIEPLTNQPLTKSLIDLLIEG